MRNFIKKFRQSNIYYTNSGVLKKDLITEPIIAYSELSIAKNLYEEIYKIRVNKSLIFDYTKLEHYTDLDKDSYGYRLYRNMISNIFPIKHTKGKNDIDAVYELIRKGDIKRMHQKWFRQILSIEHFGAFSLNNSLVIISPDIITDIEVI